MVRERGNRADCYVISAISYSIPILFILFVSIIDILCISRVHDIVDMIPQCNPDGAGRILKPEFRNALNQMMFPMEDDEFEKLWQK